MPVSKELFKEASDFYRDNIELHKNAYRVVSVLDELDYKYVHVDTSKTESLETLRYFEDVLENGYKQKLGYFQRVFAHQCVRAMAPGLIGMRNWTSMGPDVMKSRDWDKIYNITIGIAPRQFGKSTVTARLMSTRTDVFLKHMKNEDDVQVVFSVGQRASDLLREKYLKNIKERGIVGPLIIKNTQELVIVQKDLNSPKQYNYFLPSNPDKTRGVTANVMYGEEAAYIHPKVFFNVMVPLIELEHCTTILISSPADKYNYFSEIASMTDKDSGELLNNVVDMDLVCRRCRDGENPELCRHNIKFYPHWKKLSNQDFILALYGERRMTFLRESMGNRLDGDKSFFDKRDVEYFFAADEHKVSNCRFNDDIVIVCDPNAHDSKMSSEMVLIAMLVSAGTYIIIAMDAYKAKTGADVYLMLNNFITRIRADQRFTYARIIFCPEKNMGHEGSFLGLEVISNYRNVEIVSKDGNEDYGLYTSKESKIKGAFEMWSVCNRRALRFAENWICENPLDNNIDRKDDLKSKLREQLLNYRMHSVLVRGTDRVTQVISGKRDEEGNVMPNANDDMAFGMCFVLYVISMIFDRKIPKIYFEDDVETAGSGGGGVYKKRKGGVY